MTTKLVLPLMMFGKINNHWHIEGEYVKKRVQVGTAIYKSGKKKGQQYPVYDWKIDLKPQKVKVGEETITRGKNKGKVRDVFETRRLPYYSTGFFPSANIIYRGRVHSLNDAARSKLEEWQNWTSRWAELNQWETQKAETKVIAEMTFYFPDEKIRDTHNAKKLLLDALGGIIHENDMYILDRTMNFHVDPKFPRIELNFYILG